MNAAIPGSPGAPVAATAASILQREDRSLRLQGRIWITLAVLFWVGTLVPIIYIVQPH
jgi:hypothetical protein